MEPTTTNQENDFRTRAEQQANRVALANAGLANAVALLEQSLRGVRDAHRGPILQAAAARRDALGNLLALVTGNPGEFQRPRSMEFNGVSFGLRKGTGKLVLECEAETIIARIRKVAEKLRASESTEAHAAAGKLEACIVTTESLSKTALAELDAKSLKQLGVCLENTGDKPFVKLDESQDKKAAALLGESLTGEGQ